MNKQIFQKVPRILKYTMFSSSLLGAGYLYNHNRRIQMDSIDILNRKTLREKIANIKLTVNDKQNNKRKEFEHFVSVIPNTKLRFRKGHEKITLESMSFRHRKFADYRSSTPENQKHVIPGGVYNWYYINEEPIKCWKKDDYYIIQDGHRRYIEGNLQGYDKFLVEVTGNAPDCIEQSKMIDFQSFENIVIDYYGPGITISSDLQKVFLVEQ